MTQPHGWGSQDELLRTPLPPEPYGGVQYFEEPCKSCLGYTNTLPKNIEARVKAGHKISTKDKKQICFEQPV